MKFLWLLNVPVEKSLNILIEKYNYKINEISNQNIYFSTSPLFENTNNKYTYINSRIKEWNLKEREKSLIFKL